MLYRYNILPHHAKLKQFRPDNYFKLNRWKILCLITVFIFFLLLRMNDTVPSVNIFHTYNEFLPNYTYLEGDLYGTCGGGGTGNAVFEILALLSLAKKTNRTPFIARSSTIRRLNKVFAVLPNLEYYFTKGAPNNNLPECSSKAPIEYKKCCIYNEHIENVVLADTKQCARVKFNYAQSTKYFSAFSNTFVKNFLLRAKESVQRFAKYNLFEAVEGRINRTNICIHIRRGDFVGNVLSLPSDALFTRESLRYLRKKEKYENSDVYVMSNDIDWSREVLKSEERVFLANSNVLTPVNAEWEFSRFYCDAVVMTASVSTYGWWIGYLSRGQSVYYNSVYSTPGGISNELNPDDFWPSHWKKLTLRNDPFRNVTMVE